MSADTKLGIFRKLIYELTDSVPCASSIIGSQNRDGLCDEKRYRAKYHSRIIDEVEHE